MKVIIADDFAPLDALRLGDWPEPVAGSGQVVIRAEQIGVNYPDGLLVQGKYQMRPETPFVPGMEVAGIIDSVGDGVTNVKPGDRVAAMAMLGCYAEKVAVPANAVLPLPDAIGGAEACALMTGYGTSLHALKQRASLKPGEILAVAGAAGLTGGAAIQIGKAMGARVIALASAEEKRQAALAHGADEAVGYDNLRDDIKRLTDGKGIDVAYDPVGGDVFDGFSRAMAWGGRLLVIGFASGRIPQLPVNLALVKGYSAVGVFWGEFTRRQPDENAANIAQLVQWTMDGKLRPAIDRRFALADARLALEHVMARHATGKVILEP